MGSKGQHVQDNSVVERRLRPIYDWLDIGNSKKALQECDKVLKKTPNLHCAKALKAVTLHRMGKEDEAMAILDSLAAEKPTDDATLQAMTLCYRELQQLEKTCKLYETAVKLDPNNEELITQLFMSYVRIFDYKSQQQTAMTLYKNKPKTPYYCWAVMSIILQATRGEGKTDPKKRTLLLSLAERMMVKLIQDNKLDAEQEVQLYLMILDLQEKYKEILDVLDGPLGSKLVCTSPPQNRIKYLKKLDKWNDINLLCKSILVERILSGPPEDNLYSRRTSLLLLKARSAEIYNKKSENDHNEGKCNVFVMVCALKNNIEVRRLYKLSSRGPPRIVSVDRWDIWKEYINSVFKLINDSNNSFNNHGNHENIESGDLETADDTPEKCHEFICRIVENGSGGGFKLRGPYLARFELCTKLIEKKINSSDLLGDTIELFIEYFRKFGHKPCCVNDLRIYLNILDSQKKSDLSIRLIKDVGISAKAVPQSEQQMQRHLCALQLFRLCGGHRNLTKDHLQALVTAFSLHYQHGYQNYGHNLLPTDIGPSDAYAILAAHVLYDLSQVDQHCSEPIIVALILLEDLLKNSPSNFNAKLLCIRLYHTIGGTLGADKWYNSLDTKHLQLDALGFVHCARLPTTGLYSLCSNLCVTLKFFSSNYRDSSDHLTFSYKHGSFYKLIEFMDFRERLNNSLHYTTVVIDRIILDLIECSTFNINITPKEDEIQWDLLRDNSDLSVYVSWDPERIEGPPEDSPEILKFNKQNVHFLKIRSSILNGLQTGYDIIKSSDGVRTKHIEKLESILKEWREILDEAKKYNEPLRQNQVTLPLPSRLDIALKLPNYEIIGNLFILLINIGIEDIKMIDQSMETIEIALNNLLETIKNRLDNNNNNNNLQYRRESMEFIVNSVEILCISILICSLCNDLIRSITKTNKKKSGGGGGGGVLKATILSKLVNTIKMVINQLCNYVQIWGDFSLLSEVTQMLDALNLDDKNGNDVKKIIQNSYVRACDEIQNILKTKIKMLNSLIC